MAQVARNLTDAKDGFLKDMRNLIVDRDPLYTEQFKTILASGAVELLKLPPSSPNLNAFAERWVRPIKEECLDRVVPLGERHLRHLVSEYMAHFHAERNHQGLANVIPFPETTPANDGATIERRERLGGPPQLLSPEGRFGVGAPAVVGKAERPKSVAIAQSLRHIRFSLQCEVVG